MRHILNPELEALVEEFANWRDARGREVDTENDVRAPLYHYTSMAGLLGILSNEEIWFTNIFHLNDPSELAYGINIAGTILREKGNQSGNEHVAKFCAWASHVLVKAGGEIFGFYVASFSRESNDLGQWRAYADNGRGVAIELSPSLFAGIDDPVDITDRRMAEKVIYDSEVCQRNFREAIQQAVALIARGQTHVTTNTERVEFGKAMARELAVAMFRYAITCKHPAYKHERETRLLLLGDRAELDPYARFRTRGSILVPYVASKFHVRAPGAITKIIVGPAADDLALDAVRALMRRHGLSPDLIEKSDIPYTAR
jgi:hypothetical protein